MTKRSILGLVALMIMTTVVFTGCRTKQESNNTVEQTVIVSSIKGDVEIPANPTRIVDISGASEELLILGMTPVGTANTDPYVPSEFPNYIKDRFESTTIVGFSMMDTMDIEAILALDPDFIIMSERQEKIYDQLKEIAPVVMMRDYGNDWLDRLNDVAALFGKIDVAEKWIADYNNKAQEIAEEIVKNNGEESYLTVLASGGQFYIFSDAGIGAILYNDMNLDKPVNLPIQEGISLPVVTMEGLSQIDADRVIVLATDGDKKDLETSSVWNNIRAVKEGNAIILESSPYFGQGYAPIGRELLLDLIKDTVLK